MTSMAANGIAAGRPGGLCGRLLPETSRRRRIRRIDHLESLEMCINLDMDAPQRAARTKIRFLVFFLVLELDTLRPRRPRPLPTLLTLLKVPLSWLWVDPTVV